MPAKMMVTMLLIRKIDMMLMSLNSKYQLRCCAVCDGFVSPATLRFDQFLMQLLTLDNLNLISLTKEILQVF